MIIFGTRRTVQQLAMVLLTCANCHRSAANAVLKLVTKFTLFFIPLFPVRVRYSTQCTACGFAMTVDKAQAEQLAQLPPAGATPQYPPRSTRRSTRRRSSTPAPTADDRTVRPGRQPPGHPLSHPLRRAASSARACAGLVCSLPPGGARSPAGAGAAEADRPRAAARRSARLAGAPPPGPGGTGRFAWRPPGGVWATPRGTQRSGAAAPKANG